MTVDGLENEGRVEADVHRTVLLVDEVDHSGAPIYRTAVLADGDRAEARRRMVLDLLTKSAKPWLVCLVDRNALPRHLFFIVGSQGASGEVELTEFAQHHNSTYGRMILEALSGLDGPER